jgi:hypothetical protein
VRYIAITVLKYKEWVKGNDFGDVKDVWVKKNQITIFFRPTLKLHRDLIKYIFHIVDYFLIEMHALDEHICNV